MANFFDQFEAPAAPSAAAPAVPPAPAAANFFDQFDPPTPAAQAAPAQPTLKPPRSWAQAAGDTTLALGQGVESAGMFIPQLANTLTGGAVDRYAFKPITAAVDRLAGGPGEGSTLAQASQDTHNALEGMKSEQQQATDQSLADTHGFFPTIKKVLTTPSLAVDQLAQQVPQLIAPGGITKQVGKMAFERAAGAALAKGTAARIAAGMTEDAAKQAATAAANRLGQKAAIAAGATAARGTEAAMSGSQNSEQAQQEVLGMDQHVLDANPDYQALIAQGHTPQDAREAMAQHAGLIAGAAGAAITYATGGLTSKLESRMFQGHTGVNGLGQLLTSAGAKKLASATGKEFAQEGLQEGGEQFGQNLGVKTVDPNKSLMDQVPEQAALGSVLGGVMGGGTFAGSAALSHPNASSHAGQSPAAPSVPNPGAPAGSLSDTANVLHQTTQPAVAQTDPLQAAKQEWDGSVREAMSRGIDPEELASQVAARHGVNASDLLHTPDVTSAPAPPPGVSTPSSTPAASSAQPTDTAPAQARPPIVPPWVDTATGAVNQPDKGTLTATLARHIAQQYDEQGHMRFNVGDLANAWGVPADAIKRARTAATTVATQIIRGRDANAGAAPTTADTATPAPADTPAATDTAVTDNTTASIPFMVTQGMKAELRTLGHTDADISAMTSQQAHDTLRQGEPLLTKARSLFGATGGAAVDQAVQAHADAAKHAEAAAPADTAAVNEPASPTTAPAAEKPAAIAADTSAIPLASQQLATTDAGASQNSGLQAAQPERAKQIAEALAPFAPSKPLHDMTPAELDQHDHTTKQATGALENAILGDQAEAWRKAHRELNSSTSATSDRGEAALKHIEAGLHPKDVEALYGHDSSGLPDWLFADTQPLQDAHTSATLVDTPVHAATAMAGFLNTLGRTEGEPSTWNTQQRAAYAGMRTLQQTMTEKGMDSAAVQKDAIHQAASRYGDANDAEFMLQRFLEPAKEIAPKTKAIASAPKEKAALPAPAQMEKPVPATVEPVASRSSAAARDAEGLRVKTAAGELNGRTHVDQLVAQGFNRVDSTRAGDKMTHALVNAAGVREPIKARQLRYAQEATATSFEHQAHQAATSPHNDLPEPTEAQKQAGVYKKGHVRIHGMDISIENPRGSTRSGVSEDGKPWSHEMSDHYGYLRGTVGADGDHVDVYVGPKPESQRVFVVDQIDQKTGAYDEHKAMLGYATQDQAIKAYRSNFDKGWKVGRVTGMSVDAFRTWLKEGDTKAPLKPVANSRLGGVRAPKAEKVRNFSFAGEHAATADHAALNDAKQMEAMGRDSVPDRFGMQPGSPEDTHVATGWSRGADGKWRWEIDDSAAAIQPEAVAAAGMHPLGEVLDHPALFDAYPQLADIKVRTEPGLRARGNFDPKTNTITLRDAEGYEATGARSMKSVLLHEVQHVIQSHEGFARGGNLADAKTLPEFQALLAKETAEGFTDAEYRAAMRVYSRLAGEVEARNTQSREHMDAEQRQQIPPSETADVKRSAQIVRFGTEPAHDMGEPVDKRQAAHTAKIQSMADELTAHWKGSDRPRVHVVDTPEQLPDSARIDPATGQPDDAYKGARGLHDGKDVWVVANKHAAEAGGRAALQRTLLHEAVGHFGIDRIVERELGHEAWKKITAATERLRANDALGSAAVREVLARAEKDYRHADGTPASADTFARETLALMAERGIHNGLLDRAIAAVRQFVRKYMPDLKLSEAELRQLLVRSSEYLDRGQSYAEKVQARAAMAFSRDGWDEHFPDALVASGHGTLAEHPDYAAAKAGDETAALRLARDVVTPDFVQRVKDALPPDSKPIIMPVVARESAGDNEIPRMAANVLAHQLGAETDTAITQAEKVSRGGADAMHRLANPPTFNGEVKPGRDYVLLDDTLAQGGTLAQLKTHIERGGGRVVLTTALTAKEYSRKLALDPEMLGKVRARYGSIEGWWKQQFGHGFDGLTQSEARAILTFDKGRLSPDGLRNRVLAGKIPEVGRVGEAAAGDRPATEALGAGGGLKRDFSRDDRGEPTAPDKTGAPFSRSADSIETINESMGTVERTALQHAKDWIAGKAQDWKPAALGWLHLRHVAELAQSIPEISKGAKRYVDQQQRMQAMRHSMEETGGKKAKALQDYAYERGPAGWLGKLKPEAKTLFQFAHKVTQLGLDPTSAYERVLMPDDRGEMRPWTEDMRVARIKMLREQQRGRSGDDKTAMQDESKALKQLPKREKARAAKHPQLVAEWNRLPQASKDTFMMLRDHFKETAEQMLEANVGQVRANQLLPEQNRRALEKNLRDRYAQAQVNGVYFPLGRFGDYWISGRQKDTLNANGEVQPGQYFHMRFENAAAQTRQERALQAGGAAIEASGRADGKYEASKAPPGSFVAGIIDTLRQSGAPSEVLDKVYQDWLKTMPELAIAKHFIHRNNVAGYTDDVPRVFASHVQHAAIQIARATYAHELDNAMTQMEESLEAARRHGGVPASHADFRGFMDAVISRHESDPAGELAQAKAGGPAGRIDAEEIAQHVQERAALVGSEPKVEADSRRTLAERYTAIPLEIRQHYADQAKQMFGSSTPPDESRSVSDIAHADALVAEMGKRHQWLMNPTDSKWANQLNALSYLYFLGASPASAIVNLVQVPQIVLPVLGARHGWAPAARVLGKSMSEAVMTRGNMDKRLTGAELKAYQQLHDSGTFQRTQTHMLAGMASGDQMRANPALAKVMRAVSWMFQTSEVINRTGTGMAAYRLARADGMAHDAAVKYADEITNGTHGDFSNSNRSRHMQNGVVKVSAQFKSYGIAMSWLWGREMHKAFKGESPETRALARKTLTGLVGMTGLFAGAMGLPMINALKYTAQAVHAVAGDPNQPWDFDTEFRGWLSQWLGDEGASLVADGAANKVLGINLASRVGQSDLFFHDDNKQMNNQQAVENLMVSMFGPLGGIAQNAANGMDQIDKGYTSRGVETMMPSFAKNAMKSYRYAAEGVNTLQGAPIVDDVSGMDAFRQLIGFQPTTVAEQQRQNNMLYGAKDFVTQRRGALTNAYALAYAHGDATDVDDAREAIAAYNQKWPQYPIRMSDLRASLRSRATALAQSEGGVRLSGKLGAALRDYASKDAATTVD